MYGINSIYFQGANRINSLRLHNALFGNQIKGPSDFSSVSKHRYTQKKPLSSAEKAFIKSYKREMQGIIDASENFGQNGSNRTALSDNSMVASADGRLELSSDKYTIDVKSTAKEQINTSAAISASSVENFKGGELIIENESGKHRFHTSVFNKGTGKDILQSLADDINDSKIGITASLVEKDGRVSLRLKGEEGAKNAFTVSGKAADELSLANSSQSASDAQFEVSLNGEKLQDVKSSKNVVELSDRLSIKLKGVGTAVISSDRSSAAARLDMTQQLIDKFNGALKFLNDNADKGIGVLHQMKRMIIPPVSERSLELVGIKVEKDGRFTLDKDVFLKKAESSPETVNYVLDRFSSKLHSDAKIGMRESERDLLSERNNPYNMNSPNYYGIENMMKIYNRGGALALKNYGTIGYMMNSFI